MKYISNKSLYSVVIRNEGLHIRVKVQCKHMFYNDKSSISLRNGKKTKTLTKMDSLYG